ncbi:glycosyltransferase family 4 protein [Candidatus Hydrogenedentota bacterium]
MISAGKSDSLNHIAVIGNYLPRKCGIATFTTDLCDALADELKTRGSVEALVMDDIEQGYPYPSRVKFQLHANKLADYQKAADYINVNQFDVVVLQHEYGIFGGRNGAYILSLIKSLRMPVLTTLHTVLAEPTEEQKAIIIELGKFSDRLIVMSEKAEGFLTDVYGIDEFKALMIPHGIPDVPFVDPSFHKDRFGVEGRKLILTFGLLGPGKGVENMLEAMPAVMEKHPDAVYLVLGATHPHVKKASGDAYRIGLQQMVTQLSIEDHVIFHNNFVSLEVLCQYISAADVYVTPYLTKDQITSGTLAYALGAGKAVVSSPYWYAEELLADGRGRLVAFADPAALSKSVNALLGDDNERNAMRKRAYQYCRPMIWKEVARSYIELGAEITEERIKSPKPMFTEEGKLRTPDELPEINLTHLQVMTDGTGVLQHAKYATPNRDHGYCVDDNARALIAATMHYTLSQDEGVVPLVHTYLAFLDHAFNEEKGRFQNFMAYDRKWLEEKGSEDSHARALWGLAVAVKDAPSQPLRDMATRLFVEAMGTVEVFTSPRAWAFTLVGLHSYLEIYGGDADARRLRCVLAERLFQQFEQNATKKWPWCEDTVTYANAKLCHALILSGQWLPCAEMHETGIESLKWLLKQQTAPEGHLTIIGNSDWFDKHGTRANFDQQPIEAMGLVEACTEAYRSTGEQIWLQEARRCLGWFLGRNDLGMPLHDFKTGGCRDGLEPHGSNANQGAESTLAWLIALLTMYEVMNQQVLTDTEGSA